MKKLFFSLLVVSSCCYAQTKPVLIDDFVSVNMPGNPVKKDTLVNGVRLLEVNSEEGTAIFTFQKMSITEGAGANAQLASKDELNSFYKGFAETFFKDGFKKLSEKKIKIQEYEAYEATGEYWGKKAAWVQVVVLGDYVYITGYFNLGQYNEREAKAYFTSINIKPGAPAQFNEENGLGYKLGQLMALPLIVGIVLLIVFLSKRKKKAKQLDSWQNQ